MQNYPAGKELNQFLVTWLNVGPDLDPNWLFTEEFYEIFNFEKNQQTTKKAA